MIPLTEVPRVIKFIETEGSMVVARGQGRREWELVFGGYRVSV